MRAYSGRHKTSVKRKNLSRAFHIACQPFNGWGSPKKAVKTTVTKRTNRAGAIAMNPARKSFFGDRIVTFVPLSYCRMLPFASMRENGLYETSIKYLIPIKLNVHKPDFVPLFCSPVRTDAIIIFARCSPTLIKNNTFSPRFSGVKRLWQ